MNDRDAIIRLKHEYCYHLDSRNSEEFVSLFTEDAEFDITTSASGQGHGDLQDFIQDVKRRDPPAMAHMPMNHLIDIDGDQATGMWYYLVLITRGSGTTELGQGVYEETYRRLESGWHIEKLDAERQFTIDVA